MNVFFPALLVVLQPLGVGQPGFYCMFYVVLEPVSPEAAGGGDREVRALPSSVISLHQVPQRPS